MVSLLVFPVYAVGFHYFQTTLEQREPSFEVRRLLDCPLEHAPSNHQERKPEGVRVILKGDKVHCRWHLPGQEQITLDIKGDEKLELKGVMYRDRKSAPSCL